MYSDGDSQNKGYSAGCFNALQILQAKTSPWINEDLNQVFGSVPSESAVIYSSAGCRAKWDPPGGSWHFEVPLAPYGSSKTSLAGVWFAFRNAVLKNRRRVGHLLCLPSLIQMHLVVLKVTLFIQSERQHAVITAGRASHQSSSPSSSSSSWGTSSCSLMLRSQSGEILGWKWTSTVEGLFFCFFRLFSDVAFHVTNGYFPPTTGPGLPPLQRLLLLQATGNACGTCFIPSARRRYCGCSAVSRGSEEPESCFLRRNAAGISCHFRKATFILANFNNAAFRESENARLAHFPDAKEWAAVPSVKCMLGKAAAQIGSGKGSAGASASAHLAVVSRWDLMGEKMLDNWILITETSSTLIYTPSTTHPSGWHSGPTLSPPPNPDLKPSPPGAATEPNLWPPCRGSKERGGVEMKASPGYVLYMFGCFLFF